MKGTKDAASPKSVSPRYVSASRDGVKEEQKVRRERGFFPRAAASFEALAGCCYEHSSAPISLNNRLKLTKNPLFLRKLNDTFEHFRVLLKINVSVLDYVCASCRMCYIYSIINGL